MGGRDSGWQPARESEKIRRSFYPGERPAVGSPNEVTSLSVTITWMFGGEICGARVRGERRPTYVDNILAERRLRYLHVNHGLVSPSEGSQCYRRIHHTRPRQAGHQSRVSQIVQVLSTHNLSGITASNLHVGRILTNKQLFLSKSQDVC